MKGYLDIKELESYRKADIQKLARDLGVSAAGTIREIAARCAAVEVDIPGEGDLIEEKKITVEEAAAGQIVKVAEDTAGEQQPGQEAVAEDKEAEIMEDTEKHQEEAARAAGGVKVEVVTRYLDYQFNKIKEEGEVFTVGRDRAAVLLAEKVVKIKE